MIDIVVCLALVMSAGMAIALVAAARAPIGYEDESGFHYGPETSQTPEVLEGVYAHSSR